MKKVLLHKERSLPYPGKITVKLGQEVCNNDIIAVLDYVPGNVVKVPVAKILSLPKEKLEQITVVKVGDHVEEGQVLAINNVFYQPFVCKSPKKGVVGIISRHMGQMYIRDYIPLDNNIKDDVVFDLNELFPDVKKDILQRKIIVRPGKKVSPNQLLAQISLKKTVICNVYGQVMSTDNNKIVISAYKINSQLRAYIPGKITNILGRDSIKVAGEVYQLQGVYGLGGERQGHLRVVKGVLKSQHILATDTDKIIFAPDGIELQALQQANSIGVQAVITSYMPFLQVKKYAGIDFVPGITGGENITTALLLVNGFVNQSIEKDIVDFISNYNNEWVSMIGTTHIRAGALRPELILPIKKEFSYNVDEFEGPVTEGSFVEIKRTGKLHGKKGVVKSILAKPVLLPSLIKVLVAEVEVNGEIYVVPLTNLQTVGRLS
ncbi:hypothetical protein IMX26_04815 [Clostridium sp. 'deep sea']|uniref:hypothetical protein n=1 Tax=Clostridium sp. 'deep sea' TaxID=2779445 RepID=UPI00189654EF|nr:hypothetical protein [Clostridium sp. 'deep sea']QOR36138.1 hypothetical protein IMX26_04815 [Clostridium sp. 'deep sea']